MSVWFSQCLVTPDFNINYRGTTLNKVDGTTFLGITIDRNIKRKAHVETFNKKNCYMHC